MVVKLVLESTSCQIAHICRDQQLLATNCSRNTTIDTNMQEEFDEKLIQPTPGNNQLPKKQSPATLKFKVSLSTQANTNCASLTLIGL